MILRKQFLTGNAHFADGYLYMICRNYQPDDLYSKGAEKISAAKTRAVLRGVDSRVSSGQGAVLSAPDFAVHSLDV